MKNRLYLILCILTLSFSGYVQTTAQWHGPDRSGCYPEKNLLYSWPSEGPAMLWKTELIGNGYGSPTITANRIYITGEIDTTGFLFAFNLQGSLQWKSAYGKEWVVNYQGSRCAPTVVGDLIYVCSGLGDITCFDAASGVNKWSVDMIHDLHGRFTLFGHAESSLIDGDKVFLVPGGKDTNVVALNRFTGKIVWICKGKSEIPGYNSPYLIRLFNRNLLLTHCSGLMRKQVNCFGFIPRITFRLLNENPETETRIATPSFMIMASFIILPETEMALSNLNYLQTGKKSNRYGETKPLTTTWAAL